LPCYFVRTEVVTVVMRGGQGVDRDTGNEE
jgi:hypothetical protein